MRENVPSIDLITRISNVPELAMVLFFQKEHHKDKNTLIKENNEVFESFFEYQIRIFYKILTDIGEGGV